MVWEYADALFHAHFYRRKMNGERSTQDDDHECICGLDADRLYAEHITRGFLARAPVRRVLDSANDLYGQTCTCTKAPRLAAPAVQGYFIQNAMMRDAPNAAGSQSVAVNGYELSGIIPPLGGVDHAYASRFLRIMLHDIERCGNYALDDRLVQTMSDFCRLPLDRMSDTTGFSTLFVNGHIGSTCLVFRSSLMLSDMAFKLWKAGRVMFECMYPSGPQDQKLCFRSVFKGKSILEIGAGLGLNAFALGKLGARRAILTDQNLSIRDNTILNMELNDIRSTDGFSLDVDVLDLETCDKAELLARFDDVDIVIAADLTFDPNLSRLVVGAFESIICARPDRVGFLAATQRNEASWKILLELFSQSKLSCSDITSETEASSSRCLQYMEIFEPEHQMANVHIFRFIPK